VQRNLTLIKGNGDSLDDLIYFLVHRSERRVFLSLNSAVRDEDRNDRILEKMTRDFDSVIPGSLSNHVANTIYSQKIEYVYVPPLYVRLQKVSSNTEMEPADTRIKWEGSSLIQS